jgi:hypothetical protein
MRTTLCRTKATVSAQGKNISSTAAAALLVALAAAALLLSACGSESDSTQTATARNDPEAVLRAYFDAWRRNDWATLESLNLQHYPNTIYAPAASLRLLSVERVPGGSSSRVVYAVSFEFTPKGDVVSMADGRYDWTYELTWDAARHSWLISNHGGG